jgi:hypothetical protein
MGISDFDGALEFLMDGEWDGAGVGYGDSEGEVDGSGETVGPSVGVIPVGDWRWCWRVGWADGRDMGRLGFGDGVGVGPGDSVGVSEGLVGNGEAVGLPNVGFGVGLRESGRGNGRSWSWFWGIGWS